MPSVTFDTGVVSLTMIANRYPDVPGRSYPMPTQQTMGGRVLSADLGSGEWWENPPLNLERLTDAEMTTLLDYIKDDLIFATTSFTFTDAYGTDHLNMFYDGGIETASRTQLGWNVTLRLKKDMSL